MQLEEFRVLIHKLELKLSAKLESFSTSVNSRLDKLEKTGNGYVLRRGQVLQKEVMLDILLLLDRYTLDRVQLVSRSVCRLVHENLSDLCVRCVGEAEIRGTSNGYEGPYSVQLTSAMPLPTNHYHLAMQYSPTIIDRRFDNIRDAVDLFFRALRSAKVEVLTLSQLRLNYLSFTYLAFYAPTVEVKYLRLLDLYMRLETDEDYFYEAIKTFAGIQNLRVHMPIVASEKNPVGVGHLAALCDSEGIDFCEI